METLGDAIGGGKIIIMSNSEYQAFSHLVASVENISLDRFNAQRGWTGDIDITPALAAITEFAVNQQIIREAIDQLETVKNYWFPLTEGET